MLGDNKPSDPQRTTGSPADPTASTQPVAAAMRYCLGEEIARDSMGAVYRATDTVLDREVAIKLLQEKHAPNSGIARRFPGPSAVP
jgi:hypothetical protein